MRNINIIVVQGHSCENLSYKSSVTRRFPDLRSSAKHTRVLPELSSPHIYSLLLSLCRGYMFILAPFMHYHFLRLRYQSLRNNSVA